MTKTNITTKLVKDESETLLSLITRQTLEVSRGIEKVTSQENALLYSICNPPKGGLIEAVHIVYSPESTGIYLSCGTNDLEQFMSKLGTKHFLIKASKEGEMDSTQRIHFDMKSEHARLLAKRLSQPLYMNLRIQGAEPDKVLHAFTERGLIDDKSMQTVSQFIEAAKTLLDDQEKSHQTHAARVEGSAGSGQGRIQL